MQHLFFSGDSSSLSPNTSLKPLTFSVDEQRHAMVGSVSLVELARTYGTPLYVLDEATLRAAARAYRQTLQSAYSGESLPLYACKANMSMGLVKLMEQEGMGLDVVSGGELYTAIQAGFPMERVLFNGNNKTEAEIELALRHGIGRISADNFYDLAQIHRVAAAMEKKADILLRITPGIECHTHDYIKTGHTDSKFGFDIEQLPAAIGLIMDAYRDTIQLKGLHAHIGSQIFEVRPYEDLIKIMLSIYYNVRKEYGLVLEDLDLGGGLGVTYTEQDDPPSVQDALARILEKLAFYAEQANYPLPRLLMEPGRSLAAPAGITLYTIGSMKTVSGIGKKYVAVDGGMGDNIRPALYQARYSAMVANKADLPLEETVTIVGKYCESGDVLLKDFAAPMLESGDILAVFGTGAYNYSMSSNYNRFPRPATVLVENGRSHVLVQAETYNTVIQQDLIPVHLRKVAEQPVAAMC